ncbi:MAG: ABC transporter ATP-binding protein [Chitinivibrionales bacterium]
MLKIEHLRKSFSGKTVLEDISFEVHEGEVLAVIGESGQGKSVILKNIMGLIIPDGGKIIYRDKVISSPKKKPSEYSEVRKRFGMLFQGAALFDSMSVGENIAFPMREHTDLTEEEIQEKVTKVLARVGLQDIEHVMPAELSGGMRGRVGLARAVAMEPEIMLYDEPTSALDPIMSDKIDDLILTLRDELNMTSIVVTHDMSSAYKIADKIVMIRHGRINFSGTPAEIRASRDPYIQQFIKGQRKYQYAIEEEKTYSGKVDINKLKTRSKFGTRDK